jgi:hypothetical protein
VRKYYCTDMAFKQHLYSRADGRKKLTISWDNSILPSYCVLKASKSVSVCWPRYNFLWAPADTFFFEFCIKLYYSSKMWNFKYTSNTNDLHNLKACKKLHIRQLNGYQGFSSSSWVMSCWKPVFRLVPRIFARFWLIFSHLKQQ